MISLKHAGKGVMSEIKKEHLDKDRGRDREKERKKQALIEMCLLCSQSYCKLAERSFFVVDVFFLIL